MNRNKLPEEWKVLKFKDCIVQLSTGLNPRKNFSLGHGSIRYITAKNLVGRGEIDFSTSDYIDAEAKKIINKRSKIKTGDILFSSRAPIGQTYLISTEPSYFDIGESIFSIRANKEVIIPEYLCLYLSSDYFVKSASKHVTGSVIQEIRIGNLMETEIVVPPIEMQIRIAECINSIDYKIQLNNRINKKLESMAKTIYDYWFLQFEFPNESGKPYKSSGGKMVWNDELKREIPEGWKVEPLFQCMDVTYGYPLSTNFFNQEEGTPVIRIRDILDNSTSAYTTEKIPDKYISESKDLLVGMDGNFHMNYCCEDGQYINQRIVRIREKDNISTMQVCFEIAPYIKKKEQNVARSTVGHLSDKDLKSIYILNSNNSHIYKVFNGFLEKICTARKENKKLTALRDFLLPMLMNGQVTIKEKA